MPEDKIETKVTVKVNRNENSPVMPPNLGPLVISYEVRPGFVVIDVNATDADGVRNGTALSRILTECDNFSISPIQTVMLLIPLVTPPI